MKKIHKLFLIIALCACAFAGTASAQDKLPADRFELRAKTFDLIGQNRYLDALPLLEKLAPQYLDDADVWAHYGIAILAVQPLCSQQANVGPNGSRATMFW